MAVKLSRATGNFLTAGTWGTVDSTSYLNSESATSVLTTSYQASSGSTTGAITVDGVALKLSVRTGTTGTMSVHLAVAGVEVTGTLVTIDTADLPVSASADLNGGWIFFKFASPVLLAVATSYTVEAKTSSSTMVSLFSNGGTNWSRCLVTTTTGAPSAGDDIIICGEYTGQGTSNTFTVTMDETASTDYGSASTSLVTPALAICSKGVLSYGTTSATNYLLKISGMIIVYSGGTFSIGTTGTPIPRDSTAKLNIDCGANVGFGLTVRNLGTFNAQGLSRTSGKDIFYCKLNTDESANSTSLGVDTDTGWLDNDAIAIASTTRTYTNAETGALNGDAGASSLTVDGFGGTGGGLLVAHDGTAPISAEIVLLTRNVSIYGASSSLQTYLVFDPTSTIDIDWVEFYWMGSSTSLKQGIENRVTTGSFNMQYSSIHDFLVTSSIAFKSTTTSGGYTFSNNVAYNVYAGMDLTASSGAVTISGNVFIRSTASTLCALKDDGCTFTNNVFTSSASTGITISNFTGLFADFSGNIIHSNANVGIQITASLVGCTMTNNTIWRNNSYGVQTSSGNIINSTFNTFSLFGNATANLNLNSNMANVYFDGCNLGADSTFSVGRGVFGNNGGLIQLNVYWIDCDFGGAGGVYVAHGTDFDLSSVLFNWILINVKLTASTEMNASSMYAGSIVASQRTDQTDGLHKAWKRVGIVSADTTFYKTATPGERLTPNFTSSSDGVGLESASKFVAVDDSGTVSIAVWVRESVAGDGTDYNGQRARLIVKRNDALGITSDTVLATATVSSAGAWEQLSGTTASVTDSGVLEFVVDCGRSGYSTGWVTIDDWSVS